MTTTMCPMSLDDCDKEVCDGCNYDHLWCKWGNRIHDDDLTNHDTCRLCRVPNTSVQPWTPCLACPDKGCEASLKIEAYGMLLTSCKSAADGKVRVWTKPQQFDKGTLCYSGVRMPKQYSMQYPTHRGLVCHIQ